MGKIRFRLLSGTYIDENGEKWGPGCPNGSIVTSEKELDKIFLNKFERVSRPDAMSVEEAKKVLADAKAEEDVEQGARVNKYRLDKLKGGWFDVIDVNTGKPVNTKNLREKEALTLIEELGGELQEKEG